MVIPFHGIFPGGAVKPISFKFWKWNQLFPSMKYIAVPQYSLAAEAIYLSTLDMWARAGT
ncbi:hypothetical protein [sulfur-oxidizing endosymbiont of Gigantopelta aegis]|uniref:hypothetical protein n=1 Tax=sulfur-oxidizing endosymbiont of Gigantopelta aegis TaxID=2794934 RepID=UPI0018DD07CD|nr:hypothetical protein [sulfur-oxidizing endosymbiont of Gigantopelta aegis]